MTKRAIGVLRIWMLLSSATFLHAQPATADIAVPGIKWSACPQTKYNAGDSRQFQCAEALVPIDYDAPQAGNFTLALIRQPARRAGERIGTLFWNPGGPSDAGTEYLPAAIKGFPAEVQDRFDIVSWDPRGMGGRTTPVIQCFDSAATEDAFMSEHFEDSFATAPEEMTAAANARLALNKACIEKSGKLLAHVSTADNTRDLDLLRRAVGEEKITYYGTSYGTFLGATYINMFPEHVRAAVLDGGVSPSAWVGNPGEDLSLSTFVRLGSDLGSAAAISAFIDACGAARPQECAFSAGSPQATQVKWNALLQHAKSASLYYEGESIDDGKILSYVASSIYLVEPLPGFDRFPGYKAVAQTLQTLWQVSEGQLPATTSPKDSAAATLTKDSKPNGSYVTSAGRQLAVICGESPNPETAEADARQAELSFKRAGPSAWPFGASCVGWTQRAAQPYAGPWDKVTEVPVLVIGSTFDPATAFGSSVRLAQELGNARFLPVNGFGHTVLFNPNRCAQRIISDYLVRRQVPPTGSACSDDLPPFSEVFGQVGSQPHTTP